MGILTNYLNVFKQAKPYSLYVLFLLLVVYMHNQLDRYALSITSIEIAQELKYGDKSCMKLDASVSTADAKKCSNLNETVCVRTNITVNGTEKPICKYDYNGQGIEYQIIAGPAFILVFTFTGIILSLIADKFQSKRVLILTVCLIWWSVMTLLTGFVDSYWQLFLLRFGLGFGQAGCNPIAASLIADYFPLELRGAAMGIYNWGIYTGYSFSFAIGNQILKYLNWKWVYIICGAPGVLVAIVLFFTVKEPKKEPVSAASTSNTVAEESNFVKLRKAAGEFCKPTIILLCLAGSIRNAAGYVWAYNNNTYYKSLNQTPDQISSYLGIIPLVFGIIGSFVGGFVSDRVAKQAKPYQRIWILVLSQIVAAPFVFAVLYFDPPASYYFLIPTYIFGEMWVGVCLSVMVELVPEKLRTTGVGLYFFIISNIGGNMQTIVPPIQSLLESAFNLNDLDSFRAVLYIFYPGEYVLGSALFLLTLFVLKYDLKRLQKKNEASDVTNLLNEENVEDDRVAQENVINSQDASKKYNTGGDMSFRNKAYQEE